MRLRRVADGAEECEDAARGVLIRLHRADVHVELVLEAVNLLVGPVGAVQDTAVGRDGDPVHDEVTSRLAVDHALVGPVEQRRLVGLREEREGRAVRRTDTHRVGAQDGLEQDVVRGGVGVEHLGVAPGGDARLVEGAPVAADEREHRAGAEEVACEPRLDLVVRDLILRDLGDDGLVLLGVSVGELEEPEVQDPLDLLDPLR